MTGAERWLPVLQWEGLYEVSNFGRVRRLPRVTTTYGGRTHLRPMRLVRSHANDSGHHYVCLKLKGRPDQTVGVHRLVLLAFVGTPPAGHEGCHNNGDPADNRLTNLRWDSRSANTLDRVKHGTHPLARRDSCAAGHEYTPENTRLIKDGRGRVCRTCQRLWMAEHRAQKKAAAA